MAGIKKLFGNLFSQTEHRQNLLKTEMGQLILKIEQEAFENQRHFYNVNITVSETYKTLKRDARKQIEMARFLFDNRQIIIQPVPGRLEWIHMNWRGFAIFHGLVRSNLDIEPEELLDWLAELKHESENRQPTNDAQHLPLKTWPISYIVQMIERKAKKAPLSSKAIEKLESMLDWEEMGKKSNNTPASLIPGVDFIKVRNRIERLLGQESGVDVKVLPYKKLSGDNFGDALEIELKGLPDIEAVKWHRVFNFAATANGGKPSKKFLATAKELKNDIGKEWVRQKLQDWMNRAISTKMITVSHTSLIGSPHEYTWADNTVFTKSNVGLLKGLVWICQGYQDSKTVNLVADLCEKSMKKVPGVGPAAQAAANACLWYLEVTPGTEATARLSRLSTAIKQKSVQKKVAEIVAQKAKAAGITTIELEERVVPTYGLTAGEKEIKFGDYTFRVTVEGPGKVVQTWLKPDGKPQKTKPKFINEQAPLKSKFEKLKDEITALKKVLSAQRDRIDKLFAEYLEWPLEDIETYYVGHDLICTIAGRLIWELTTAGRTTAAIWQNQAWSDVQGKQVKTGPDTKVRLWHPIDQDIDNVVAWREHLSELEIVQPTKQAYREVYLLTNAEKSTRVYSNRMAAHMLKQHQMATLMASRGWRYQLMGAYDDGLDDQWAWRDFVTSDLKAEYLLHTNWDEENWNDAGIYLYVGTDQLRFVRNGTPVDMETVPPRLLSETMREADLFVGVASVGNDPAWHDQGPTPEARNYWQSYSFGNLDNFAETRKAVLETLIPRLKIRDVAHVEGKFLIVDGKLNTYKIHLGSSNILMSPGDRYLCIVPGGVQKIGKIMLPFEGDNRLSVILSKAMMLAEDDKIQAKDIVSQLKK